MRLQGYSGFLRIHQGIFWMKLFLESPHMHQLLLQTNPLFVKNLLSEWMNLFDSLSFPSHHSPGMPYTPMRELQQLMRQWQQFL